MHRVEGSIQILRRRLKYRRCVDDRVDFGLGRGRNCTQRCACAREQQNRFTSLVGSQCCGRQGDVAVSADCGRTRHSRVQKGGDGVVDRVAPSARQFARDRKGQA